MFITKYEYIQCFIGWLLRNSALKHDYLINKKRIPLINSLIAFGDFYFQSLTVKIK